MRPLIASSISSHSYRAILQRFQAPSTRLIHSSAQSHLHRTIISTKLSTTISHSKSTYTPPKRNMSTSPIPDRYKLVFFVPHSHVEVCKDAVFDTGAGTFPGGKYSKCCFQMPGQGQFMPADGANPAIGAVGALELVQEMKVEVICVGRSIMLHAVEALKKAHPYEEVAYEVYKMENV